MPAGEAALKMNDLTKNILLWVVIVFVLLLVFSRYMPSVSQQEEIKYSTFLNDVKAHQVDNIVFQGDMLYGVMKDHTRFKTYNPETDYTALIGALEKNDVGISGEAPKQPNFLAQLLLQLAPALLLILVFVYMLRQMQGASGGRGAMSFGKSRARLLGEDQVNVTFADVAGVDEAKQEVSEIVDFLKDPGKFQKLGGKIPKGVLMVGSPGTGKTLLARAIAGEAKVPFFTISGSDFVEMFVGVGASRVRDMFEQAKKHAPCIIFIDEIDAVGRHRGAGLGGGHDEREQTLNQLLVEMDGFEGNEGIIVIAATNRPDVLDPALLRPGRFDRQVIVPLPDVRGREQILRVHMRRVPLGDDVKPALIARGTPGFSGADLANLVNEAALFAARANKRIVSMEEFERAKDKIMMGAERRSMVMSLLCRAHQPAADRFVFEQHRPRRFTVKKYCACGQMDSLEDIDVDRIQVSLNNLITDRDNFINTQTLSVELLKFQMNYPMDEVLQVAGNIEQIPVDINIDEYVKDWDYRNRPDYSVLEANRRLQELSVRNNRAAGLPYLSANAAWATIRSPKFCWTIQNEHKCTRRSAIRS